MTGAPAPESAPGGLGPTEARPGLLTRWGRSSWLLLGIFAALGVILFVLYALRDITIPLLLAMIIGVLFEPVVAWLERHRVPRWLGAALALVGLLGIFIGAFAVVVFAIADQWGAIVTAIETAVDQIQSFIDDRGWDIALTGDGLSVPDGAFGSLLSGVSTVFGVLFGLFIGIVILYLTLLDPGVWSFIARLIPLPRAQAEGIVDDTLDAVRGYFKGQTLIGLSNLFGTWFGLAIIGVPSALAIGVVTFVTSYIPYIGAFAAGAFAVVIALGAGGLDLALLALIVVLIVQNVLQNLIAPFVFSSTLKLNPILVLVSTIAGGIVAGIWGAMLGTPFLAAAIRAGRRIREYEAREAAAHYGGATADPPGSAGEPDEGPRTRPPSDSPEDSPGRAPSTGPDSRAGPA